MKISPVSECDADLEEKISDNGPCAQVHAKAIASMLDTLLSENSCFLASEARQLLVVSLAFAVDRLKAAIIPIAKGVKIEL